MNTFLFTIITGMILELIGMGLWLLFGVIGIFLWGALNGAAVIFVLTALVQ